MIPRLDLTKRLKCNNYKESAFIQSFICVLTCYITCSCATCSQDHFNCPGHYGHIEVPIPAYNPMFFDNLYAILRSKCVYCHHFRISRAVVKLYISTSALFVYTR